jgi:hypothetical protein
MLQAAHQFAQELGVTDAEVLMLAREIAGEEIRTTHELSEDGVRDLISALLRIQDAGLVALAQA